MKEKIERCMELLEGPCPSMSTKTVVTILSEVLEELKTKEK